MQANILPIEGIDVLDVVANPSQYPDEVVLTVVDAAAKMARRAGDIKKDLEAHIVHRMKKDGATKMIFKDADGNDRQATLKKGLTRCEDKSADESYRMFGFDPLEIGDYVFKPSWSKAKEARKFGGEKQQVIDTMFVDGKESLLID